MYSYQVIVQDQINQNQMLCIPCAETETAVLVQKNLQSLFPESQIIVRKQESSQVVLPAVPNCQANNQALWQKHSQANTHNDFAELEEDLFEDVA